MASRSELERLLISLDTNVQGFRDEMRDHEQTIQRSTGNIERSLQGFRRNVMSSFKGIGGALAAAFSAQQVSQFVGETGKAAEEIQRQSEALGASAEEIQTLTYTFNQFELGSDDVADALSTLTDRAQEAKDGTKSFVEDFQLVGVTVDDLRGKRPVELFRLLAERISQIEDPGKRTTAAVRIFGDELGRRLNPLLREGSEALDEYAQELRDAGGVMEDDVVKGAAATQKAFRELRDKGVKALRASVAELMVDLGEFANMDMGLTRIEKLERKLRELDETIGDVETPGTESFPIQQQRRRETEAELFAARHAERLAESAREAQARSRERRRRREQSERESQLQPFSVTETGELDTMPPASEIRSARDALDNIAVSAERMSGAAQLGEIAKDELQELPELSESITAQIDQQFAQLGDSMGQSLLDATTRAMMGMETEWDETLERMAKRAAASAIFSALGSVGGPIGAIAGFLGFGERASGGPVMTGQTIIGGEKRPELFTAHSAGHIEPRVPQSGKGDLHVHVDARNSTSPAQVEEAARRAVMEAVRISNANMMSTLRNQNRPSMS